MNKLKEEKNRGYVIAGIAGIVAFIAFFLPYVTASGIVYGSGASWTGSTMGGGLYFEFLASLVAVAVPLVLIYRNNAFGLPNVPLDRQVRYGIFILLGAGIVGLLSELIVAVNHNNINGLDLTGSDAALSIGWWLYLFSAIAIVVGSVMALRNLQALTPSPLQYPVNQYPYNQTYSQPYPPQSAQYPPYSTTGQPQYPSRYPLDPEQDQATEPGQQYAPTERRPTPQTGPRQDPNTGPQSQPYPPSELPPPPPPPHSSPL